MALSMRLVSPTLWSALAIIPVIVALKLLVHKARRKQIFLVGCGNVGAGIGVAFARAGWRVIAVDPSPILVPKVLRTSPHEYHQKTVEDIEDEALDHMLSSVEIVYCAECGNRDAYSDPDLGKANATRFEAFARRLPSGAKLRYVCGSWTRREMRTIDEAAPPVVDDTSAAKADAACNPYERAKNEACEQARTLGAELGLHITFCDWSSVVPNLAPNFTVSKMVDEAMSDGTISYSDGDVGRPLCHSADAGRALVQLVESQRDEPAPSHRVAPPPFEVVLVPGAFTPFAAFASAVQTELASLEEGSRVHATLTPKADHAPTFLRTRCTSARLAGLGFMPDEEAVQRGLRDTARARWESARARSRGSGAARS